MTSKIASSVISHLSPLRPCSSSCLGTRNAGGVALLLPGVARQLDDLEAIAQRPRDRVELVGGRDEHHLRQIEGDLEVVIAERVVLFGIEDLEQRARRVAPEVVPELVDL